MITASLPIRTVSALNVREHWSKRTRRVNAERYSTRFGLMSALGNGWEKIVRLPVRVTLVRHGPVLLDTDNLPGSLKGVRDELATILGVTDGPTDKRVSWAYDQVRGPYAVVVRIEPANADGSIPGEEWCG